METAEHPTLPTRGTARAPQALVLDRYRLIRRLGAGGFGVVWLAHDEHLDRTVAVKRVPVDGGDPERAQREALAAARLQHPGIVALYETGRDDDAVYLISELVRGRTVAELDRAGELSDRDVIEIGIALCDALAHAHRRGVVHRDVKPGNVLVPDDPHEGASIAKLTDFGVARVLGDEALTATGDVVGTLAYMAPEQAEGHEATAESDLYSLALVLYEALAGTNPVRGRGVASTARRVGARMPALQRLRRDLPADLCAAIDTALRPRPDERGTLRSLRHALVTARTAVDDEPGTIAPPRDRAIPPLTALPGPHVSRARPAPPPTAPLARAANALAAGALTAAALSDLHHPAPVRPTGGALAAALVVAVLPRLGWWAVAVALFTWLAGPVPGLALALAALVVPTLLLLRRSPGAPLWVPAIAPLLGAIGLAGAYPALAGQAPRAWQRGALGALGAWWLCIAELVVHDRLALGPPHGAWRLAHWQGSAGAMLDHAFGPLTASPILALAGVWAAFALVLPAFVRGRALAADLVLTTAWCAGLAAATQSLARAATGAPAPRGLVAGAVAAGLIVVLTAASPYASRTRLRA